MFEPTSAPRLGAASGGYLTATVDSVDTDGVTLLITGQTAPTQKKYRRLASASVEAGDRVLCVRTYGTIVVLGKIV